jgi:hypothetical protein
VLSISNDRLNLRGTAPVLDPTAAQPFKDFAIGLVLYYPRPPLNRRHLLSTMRGR